MCLPAPRRQPTSSLRTPRPRTRRCTRRRGGGARMEGVRCSELHHRCVRDVRLLSRRPHPLGHPDGGSVSPRRSGFRASPLPMISIAKEPMMCFLPLVVVVVGFFGNVRYPLYGKSLFRRVPRHSHRHHIRGPRLPAQPRDHYVRFRFRCSEYFRCRVLQPVRPPHRPPVQGVRARTDPSGDAQRFRLQGDILGGFGKGLAGLGESELGRLGRAFVAIRHHRIPRHDGVRGVCGGGGRFMPDGGVHDPGGERVLGALSGGMFPTPCTSGTPCTRRRGKDRLLYARGVSYFILLSTGLSRRFLQRHPG